MKDTNTVYNTELLKMLYNENRIVKHKGSIIFETPYKQHLKVFVYKEDKDGECFENVLRHQIVKNILVIQDKESTILFNLDSFEIIGQFNCIDYGYEIFFDEAIIIIDEYSIVHYRFSTGDIKKYDTKRNYISSATAKQSGKTATLFNLGNSIIVLNIRTGELLRIIQPENIGYTFFIDYKSNYFCDLVIFEVDHSIKNAQPSHFICGTKCYTRQEYLDYIGIKSVETVYKDNSNSIIPIEEIDHYNVITSNNKKGVMSHDMRKLIVKGNLFKSGNILTPDFSSENCDYTI